jgi:hypothetical protein
MKIIECQNGADSHVREFLRLPRSVSLWSNDFCQALQVPVVAERAEPALWGTE